MCCAIGAPTCMAGCSAPPGLSVSRERPAPACTSRFTPSIKGNAMRPFDKQFLVATIAALAGACACMSAFAAEPIKIGVAVGLSGANSVVAPAVVQSSQLAVDEINASGGIMGRPIQLEITDDASGA